MTTRVQDNARVAVARAIRDGRLTRQPCEVCGAEPSDAHHDDYGKPLEVRFLCRLHHRWLHRYGNTVEDMRVELERVA